MGWSGVIVAVSLALAPARASEEAPRPARGVGDWVQVLSAGGDGEPAARIGGGAWGSDEELLGLGVAEAYYLDPTGTLEVDPLYLDLVDPAEFDLPVVVNEQVVKWLRYFTGRGRKYYARWLARSTRVRPLMYRELEARGLPRDLVYLSMIESGYSDRALSHAGAGGMWQFMPATGRMYDLRVDVWVDDRRDPYLATVAAAEHLQDLHEMFDDWYLAFAGYNAGPGRVRRAIERSGSRDFWVHAAGPYLHSETDNYVPKILAAAIIGKHPERYGFTSVAYQDELRFETTRVEGAADVDVLAECAGIEVEDLRALNPWMKRATLPPQGHLLHLPPGHRLRFDKALAAIPTEERVRTIEHVVQRGETLSGIASTYGVSLAELSGLNRIHNPNRISVGSRLTVPRGESGASARAQVSRSTSKRPDHHVVARGETLSGIASRYGRTVAQLREANGLRGDVIQPGQRLALQGSRSERAVSTRTEKVVVAAGDTLSQLAARYEVRTADLAAWNGLGDSSHLRVGQVLTVHAPTSDWTTHTVTRGDTLSEIASRYGCSTTELASWNGLSGSVIRPGQKLKVKKSG